MGESSGTLSAASVVFADPGLCQHSALRRTVPGFHGFISATYVLRTPDAGISETCVQWKLR